MIRVRQVEVDINKDTKEELLKKTATKLKIDTKEIHSIKINKKSLDARKKPNLKFIYEIDISCIDENKTLRKNTKDVLKTPDQTYKFNIHGTESLKNQIIIVGAGPAGLFCAYLLAENGYKPLVIERGEDVDHRIHTVQEFWSTGVLNQNSNVQFGEGGAGTFSDGKLNTLSKDSKNRMRKVFETFVLCGANEEILYENKPHIGTDILRNVIKNMRNKIVEMGGEFRYNACLTNLTIKNQKLVAIEVNHREIIPCENLVLAIGHSARDTFEMLYDKNIEMTPKPFSVGIRIEHPQSMINISQYGMNNHPKLKAASYKLTYQASTGRGVYSFCMCPGGYVVNASSEDKMLTINGMSNYKRDSKNANSAIVVTVTSDDFGSHPLDGLEFQRKLESIAYKKGQGKIPIQLYKDFKENRLSTQFGNIEPIFKGMYTFANLNEILPTYICSSLKEGIEYFGTKIKGYDREDAIIAGIESRTSSPVRIIRDAFYNTNVKGIYPCGEGAGYAGGITTAAMDGIKVAEAITSIYKND